MTTNGYITLDRKILEWEWYTDANTKLLFLHLLLIVNFKDSTFKGEIIKRGSIATTVEELSRQTKLTPRNIRTALKHLKATNEVTIKTSPKYSVITVTKYDEYQRSDKRSDKQVTNKRQTEGSESDKLKNKQDNKNKQDKRIYKRAGAREGTNAKIHNFPEREYDFDELAGIVRKRGQE